MDDFYGFGSYGPPRLMHSQNEYRTNRHYDYHVDPTLPSYMSSYSVPKGGRGNSIYGQPIVDLSRATQHNLDRLKTKLVMIDPCYELGIENWHSNNKRKEREPHIYPSHATPTWEATDSVFADRKTFDTMRNKHRADDFSEKSGPVNKFCHLCTTLDEHRRHLARRGINLKAAPKRKPRITYVAPSPSVYIKGDYEVTENTDVLYKIIVRTGTKPDAGTTANVFIQLKGRMGNMKKRQLKKNMSVGYAFGRGTKETFYVKGPKLGDLTNLIIEHDGVEKKHSWFLEDVEVTDMATQKTWIFPFRNWISVYLGDGVIKRNIKAYVKDVTQQEYMVSVWTGNLTLAGTDSKVFITLYGKEGVGPRTRLLHDKEEEEEEDRDPLDRKQAKGLFRRGKKDTFVISSDYHGPLSKIRIEHDDSGKKHPDWFLEKIEVREVDNEKVIVFPCGMWLSSEGRNEISYDLFPVKHIPKHLRDRSSKRGSTRERGSPDRTRHAKETRKKQTGKSKDDGIKYEVITETADVKYSGTDANVYILIVGKLGKTDEILLDNEKNNFERGMKDVFTIYGEDVGDIKKIKIRHDNTGVGSGWFLATVIVKRFFTDKEVTKRMAELDVHLEEEALRGASEIAEIPLSGAKAHKKSKLKKSSRSGSAMSLHSIQEEDEEEHRGKKSRKKSRHKQDDIDSDEDSRLRRLYQKGSGKRDDSDEDDSDDEKRSNSSRRKGSKASTSGRKKKKKGSSSSSDSSDSEDDDKKKESKEEEKKSGVFQNLGRRMSKFFGINNEEEEKKNEDRKKEEEKREKKEKKKKKHRDEEDSDDGKRKRKRIDGKKKKLYSYGGVDQWVTDSNQDSDDSDDGKRRRRKKRSDTESDSDDSDHSRRGKRRGKYQDDDDKDRKRGRKKSKNRNKESDDDSDDDNYSPKRRGRKKTRHSDSSDSEDERRSRSYKKKGVKYSDEESEDSSDENESQNLKLYKEWRHNRVPYCDEYYFVCKRWLATDEDDGEILRQLKPKSITTFYKIASKKKRKKQRRD